MKKYRKKQIIEEVKNIHTGILKKGLTSNQPRKTVRCKILLERKNDIISIACCIGTITPFVKKNKKLEKLDEDK
jgi:hypothetical protein